MAEVELKSRYEDAKAVLGVPWMGVVMMAFAHYPNFYDMLWQGVRPLCLTAPFVSIFRNVRKTHLPRVERPSALAESSSES